MTIHYKMLRHGGMKATYLSQPKGDLDTVIREALTLQQTRIITPQETVDKFKNRDNLQSFITQFTDSTLYFSPHTRLPSSTYNVKTHKNRDYCIVGIHIRTKNNELTLKTLIEYKEINGVLIPAGLIPIKSTIDQIPYEFFCEVF
ncbi:hypothetical protein GOV12_00760 [Candidatus Pacearchaeota archaeon]|nr:hypothetical protein [Candidatus Pacearchaeota archaeon]